MVFFGIVEATILGSDRFQPVQVEAFPTLWVFGLPKVDPIIQQGFLEKPQLEELNGWGPGDFLVIPGGSRSVDEKIKCLLFF